MTSLRQIEANRRNARLSTGPVTEQGKKRSRRNALRHGLAAETVIASLEDADDYAAFEMAIKADHDPQTAVERELVLRLASLLWRLRRATAIESGLFDMGARQLLQFRPPRAPRSVCLTSFDPASPARSNTSADHEESSECRDDDECFPVVEHANDADGPTRAFVNLTGLPTTPLDRLHRYETALWRQVRQILVTLARLDRRRPWERTKF